MWRAAAAGKRDAIEEAKSYAALRAVALAAPLHAVI